ncbi:hypothetical protein QQP08_007415 [Theobroma cacao]|nr:hypothetical protein QQP08_007415 [Theobroma cacao]
MDIQSEAARTEVVADSASTNGHHCDYLHYPQGSTAMVQSTDNKLVFIPHFDHSYTLNMDQQVQILQPDEF